MPVLSHSKMSELYPDWWKMDKGTMPNFPKDIYIIVQEDDEKPYSVIDNREEQTYFYDFATWYNVRIWFKTHGMPFMGKCKGRERK